MERLKHRETGVVVSVDADTASRLGGDWVPVPATAVPPRQAKAPKLKK